MGIRGVTGFGIYISLLGLISLACIFFAPKVKACDSVFIGAVSYHFDRSKDYNEKHHLLGCENAIGRLDVLYFRNSKRRHSFYVGEYFQFYANGRHSFGADLGVVTGYKDRPSGFGDLRYNYRATPDLSINVRFGIVVFVAGPQINLR